MLIYEAVLGTPYVTMIGLFVLNCVICACIKLVKFDCVAISSYWNLQYRNGFSLVFQHKKIKLYFKNAKNLLLLKRFQK